MYIGCISDDVNILKIFVYRLAEFRLLSYQGYMQSVNKYAVHKDFINLSEKIL